MSHHTSLESAAVPVPQPGTQRLAHLRTTTVATFRRGAIAGARLLHSRVLPAMRAGWHYLCHTAWPALKRGTVALYQLLRQHTLPTLRRAHTGTLNFYRNHAWVQRCGSALNKKAIGLGVAMLAAKLVSNMVETPQWSNLWGVTADKPLVSETTYSMLLFMVEYLVALLVFAGIDYAVAEFRRRTEQQTS